MIMLLWWLKIAAWMLAAAGALWFAIRRERRLQRQRARRSLQWRRLDPEDWQALEDELG